MSSAKPVSSGFDPNLYLQACHNGDLATVIQCQGEFPEKVQKAKNMRGYTDLMVAVKSPLPESLKVVQFLANKGGGSLSSFVLDPRSNTFITAFNMAAQGGNLSKVKALFGKVPLAVTFSKKVPFYDSMDPSIKNYVDRTGQRGTFSDPSFFFTKGFREHFYDACKKGERHTVNRMLDEIIVLSEEEGAARQSIVLAGALHAILHAPDPYPVVQYLFIHYPAIGSLVLASSDGQNLTTLLNTAVQKNHEALVNLFLREPHVLFYRLGDDWSFLSTTSPNIHSRIRDVVAHWHAQYLSTDRNNSLFHFFNPQVIDGSRLHLINQTLAPINQIHLGGANESDEKSISVTIKESSAHVSKASRLQSIKNWFLGCFK